MTDPTTTDSGIDLADQLVQDLRETYGAIWLFMPRVVALIERLRLTEAERKHLKRELAAAVAYNDGKRERIQALETTLEDEQKYNTTTACAYCGADFPRNADETAIAIDQHVRECVLHPMYQQRVELEEQVERLTEELERQKRLADQLEQLARDPKSER